MHNRKKSDLPPSEAQVTALANKCQIYQTLITKLFDLRKNNDTSEKALKLTGDMLKMNPDFYSLWNYRREILIANSPLLTETISQTVFPKLSDTSSDTIRDAELNLTVDGIKKNPKSYGAWYHRLWVVDHYTVDHDHELELCKELLREDQRNFHCWNYRRKIVNRAVLSGSTTINVETELEFTKKKIEENFSNYSAFHQRSALLKLAGRGVIEELANELSTVENAVFTEPDDQSAWWYHQFLLNWAKEAVFTGADSDTTTGLSVWFTSILSSQLDLMKSLLEIEPNCHWVMLCVVSIIQHLVDLHNKFLDKESENCDEKGRILELLSEQKALLNTLIEADGMHKNRYKFMLRAMHQEKKSATTYILKNFGVEYNAKE